MATNPPDASTMPTTRAYQQEMLDESMKRNIIIALDTGSGKTHIAILRLKAECERERKKVSWFLAPTVVLCEQQRNTIVSSLPVPVGIISGALEPDQWKDRHLWRRVVSTHRIIVSTPQVLLDALRHGYLDLSADISLIVFDEAHHAVDKHPYNLIMSEFYFRIPIIRHESSDTTSTKSRPKILGLTASPIFGGDVEKAFQTIEDNLDCTIRAPQLNRDELAKYVHRPKFEHVFYPPIDRASRPYSANLVALENVYESMDIEDDPNIKSLRRQLASIPPSSPPNPPDANRTRLDQKLSKLVNKRNTNTHRDLRDLARSASDICFEVGPWAADWFVQTVVKKAMNSLHPNGGVMPISMNPEKRYLYNALSRIHLTTLSTDPASILASSSPKVNALISRLLHEKTETEDRNEAYSCLCFVTRRDVVLALANLLIHHPFTTSPAFAIGTLLGTSDSAYRTNMLDLTRDRSRQSQHDTLADFRIGERNLIISTSVAEEGLDIQACGSVIRWDPPANMASWAQSRGRARRVRSTFTVMFEDLGGGGGLVGREWEKLEEEMMAAYQNPLRADGRGAEGSMVDVGMGEGREYRVEATGALLTMESAIPHLNHFCAVIPTSLRAAHVPLYDLDPLELPPNWHTTLVPIMPYEGPWGCTVTLPKVVPPELRIVSTPRLHSTKLGAQREVAFKAYLQLYHAGLLNDHLLPFDITLDPEDAEQVKEILKDVEKRESMSGVSAQMDPWTPEDGEERWHVSELKVDGLSPLRMFTRSRPIALSKEAGPVLYRSHTLPIRVGWEPALTSAQPTVAEIEEARQYTRRIMWTVYGTRMKWDDLDYAYLFLPSARVDDAIWSTRLSWLQKLQANSDPHHRENEFQANAEAFAKEFGYVDDLAIVKDGVMFAKAFYFLGWKNDPVTQEEEETMRVRYAHHTSFSITYPLLKGRVIPKRMNLLQPVPAESASSLPEKTSLLFPSSATVTVLPKEDLEYAFLLPSILRSLSKSLTVHSLRRTLLSGTALETIPDDLLGLAISSPVAQERFNYQRLETLGDTVLKFITGMQLLADHPGWHEGYLSKKKDHAVSNVRLAKEACRKELYRWIIRDRLVARKWKPLASSLPNTPRLQPKELDASTNKHEKTQQLSTKMVADVVESLIGAAYLHGRFDLAITCAELFGLGIEWKKLNVRLETLISRVEPVNEDMYMFPEYLEDVERMLGYKFERKLLLIEALTHASYQHETNTVSYERMEFLGDSVLDMVVTDYLYHAPGKEYSPGHMHLRKSSVVNAHFLAYICLRCSTTRELEMPERDENNKGFVMHTSTQQIHLWQCLLHSNPVVGQEQQNTFARYRRDSASIESALQTNKNFPWAALTRLQAPKFLSDMIESLIGAIYIDSEGSFDIVRQVLRRLGILPVLERIVEQDIDILHPVSRLSLWTQMSYKTLKFKFDVAKGVTTCIIEIDGEEQPEGKFESKAIGRAAQEETKFMAAEQLIVALDLRNEITRPAKRRKLTKNNKKVTATTDALAELRHA